MKTGRRLSLILSLLCLPFLAFSVYAGYVSFWTDSELWNTAAVVHLFGAHDFYEFQGKPLFNLILWLNLWLARPFDLHPIYTARILFALNSFLMIFIFQRLTRQLSRQLFVSLALTVLLFSNSIFIKRFGEVRSDVLVTTLVLALWWASCSRWWKSRPPHISLMLSLGAAAFIMAVTPKSLLFTLPWLVLFESRNAYRLARKHKRKVIGAGLVALILSLIVISRSLGFFIASLGLSGAGEMGYFDPHRLEHVARLLRENPVILLFWAFNLYNGLFRRRDFTAAPRAAFDFANLTLLALAIYPDRLPFLIVSMLPFWLIPVAAAWPALQARPWAGKIKLGRVLAVVMVFGALNAAVWSLFVINNNNSANQQTFIDWVGSYKRALGRATIYDAAGIAPFESANHWFIGPSEAASNADTLRRLQAHPPDVIFYVTKLLYLEPGLTELLKDKYWYDGSGIYIRRHTLAIHAGEIPKEELLGNLNVLLPVLEHTPWQKIYLELQSPEGLDLSRFGRWRTHAGEDVEFNNRVSVNEMENFKSLIVPRGASLLVVMPTRLTTPFSMNWAELFRFNPEI